MGAESRLFVRAAPPRMAKPITERELPGDLVDYGWTPAIQASLEAEVLGRQLVRIARVDRGRAIVATAGGLATAHLRRLADGPPVTGDWAMARVGSDGSLVVDMVLPRTSAITRANAEGTGEQVLVANVDTMFVLHGVDRPHRVGRLERLCILSWDAGAKPVIILTKTDLLGTGGAVIDLADAVAEIHGVLRQVEVIAVSTVTGEGIDALTPHLGPGTTVGVVGESGAGKSSLVNRLVGDDVQPVGRTRRGDHKGRHTTTSRELVPLAGGAVLVDTPGLRTIAMPGSGDGLSTAYEDLEELFERCRFRDCQHRSEPGCAIRSALRDGEVSEKRWAGYRKLEREIAHESRRTEQRTRRTEQRQSRRARQAGEDTEPW